MKRFIVGFFGVIIVLATAVIALAADDCGGIKNGTITKTRTWAHADRNNPANSEGITLTAVNWVDYDKEENACNENNNHWDSEKTEWSCVGGSFGDSGTCYPLTGVSTIWRPKYYGDTYQVVTTLKDEATPNNDSDKVVYTPVKAFEVKVDMQVIKTFTPSGSSTTLPIMTLWEYESGSKQFLFANIPLELEYLKWEGNKIDFATDRGDKTCTVHIDYIYQAVPGNADLNGELIHANLKTHSGCTLAVDTTDIDLYDGDITIDFGISAPIPGVPAIGMSLGTSVTFDGDCAEGTAVASWGLACTHGLGSIDPVTNSLKQTSESVGEDIDDHLCVGLSGAGYPHLAHFEHNPATPLPKSHTPGYTKKGMPATGDNTVQVEWIGYVHAELGSTTTNYYSGAYAKAELEEFWVKGWLFDVSYGE